MNCILLERTEITTATGDDAGRGGRAELRGRRARHVAEVLRAEPGRIVRVGVLGGRLGRATVASLSDETVELKSIELDAEPPPALPIALCVALPRPKSLRRVLHAAASLGVKRIVLMGSWRVDKSYWQSPLLTPDAIRSVLILALEQAVDTVLPTVEVKRRFRPFVEDEVPALIQDTTAVVAHPGSAESMPTAASVPMTLFVGPDRGFTQFEIELLGAHGVRSCHIGARVLRVDEAVPALLGRLLPQ
jgi:16S rRNA (uracil1498-N3)-methyltransferase